MELKGKTINNRYLVKDYIAQGIFSDLYLAEDLEENKKQITLKILKSNTISNRIEDFIRFKSDINLLSEINHPNLIKVYSINEIRLDNVQNTPYLVMEYLHGENLAQMIEKRHRISILDTITIISALCNALTFTHNKGLIHRDLKPSNVYIPFRDSKPDFAGLKIIDFGFSHLKEYSQVIDTNNIIQTFGYLSPEQMGTLKREVDERSDLYSIGALFYHLLTEKLPFTGDDASSIIHQHIATLPKNPHEMNSNIPKDIGRIVLKLLEKEPVKRYQTANGLLKDLNKYRKGETNFILGQEDSFIKLSYKTELIGRDKEISHLKQSVSKALSGYGSIALISGDTGIGKTRLANEVRQLSLTKKKTILNANISSSFSKVPYSPYQEILNQYIDHLNKRPKNEIDFIKQTWKKQLGDLAGILVHFSPSMENMLEDIPPLIALDPERENQRFIMVITNFFLELSKMEQGLILVLDEMENMDEGSISLTYSLLQSIKKYPLFILGTYRDSEVNETHPLADFLQKSRENHLPLNRYHLNPMDEKDHTAFIYKLLYDDSANAGQIADLLYNKSKGNPLFTIDILKHLVDEGGIYYQNQSWNINHDLLKNIKISNQIVDNILLRINKLGDKEKDILSIASMISGDFPIELLFELTSYNQNDIVSTIDQAINMQILEENNNKKGQLTFVHNRIKEAFFESINKESRKNYHQKILEYLKNQHNENKEGVIHELAYHCYETGNTKEALTYIIPAGLQAKKSFANEDAIKYFKMALDIMQQLGEEGSDRWLLCEENMGAAYLTLGENDAAIEIYRTILPFMFDQYKKVECFKQISKAYFKKGDWVNAEIFGKQGLKLLGEYLPRKRFSVIIGILYELIKHLLHVIFPFFFIRKKPSKQVEKYKLIIGIYESLNFAYGLWDVLKFLRSTIRMLNIAQSKCGISKETGVSLAAYGAILMAIPLFKSAQKYYEKAIEMLTQINENLEKGKALYLYSFCQEWMGKYKKGLEYDYESQAILKQVGDLRELGMAYSSTVHNHYFLADYSPMKEATDKYADIAWKTKDVYGISAVYVYEIQRNLEIGHYDQAEKIGLEGYEFSKENNATYNFANIGSNLGNLYLEKGEIPKAIQFLEKSKTLVEDNNFLKQYTIYVYPYLAESYLADYLEKQNQGLNKKELQASLKKVKKACRSTRQKTSQWSTHIGASLRVNAKYYHTINKNKKAEKQFKQSIDHCIQYNRKYELGKSLYDYALFLEAIGQSSQSQAKMETAYRIFKEIGANIYTNRAGHHLGIAPEEETTAANRLLDKQRLSSIIKVSQGISSILNLNELLTEVLSKSLEVTGATRGFIFIYNDKTQILELKASQSANDSAGYEYSKEIVDQVFSHSNPLLIKDAESHPDFKDIPSVKEYNLKAILCMPLTHRDKKIGVYYLDNPLTGSVFSEEDIEILSVLITQVSISLVNANLYSNLEERVKERTAQLQETLEEVQQLKQQQDGDYFLTSLLIEPLAQNRAESKNTHIDVLVKEKKQFQFRKWEKEIGGDLCISQTITLKNKEYSIILNADAMGKSMQGAGGALVLGAVFQSIIARTSLSPETQDQFPEQWIKFTFTELQKVFESFDGSMLMSLILGLLDSETGVLYYINAEHPWMVLYRNDKATFIKPKNPLRKLGTPIYQEWVSVETFRMLPGDIILMGSDGKDDIKLGKTDTGERIINEDETLFLKMVEKGRGDLSLILEKILQTGELTDDLSLLRLAFKEDAPLPVDKPNKEELTSLLKEAKSFIKKGELEKGLQDLLKAYSLDRYNAGVIKALVYAYLKLHQYSNAIHYAELYLNYYPNDDEFIQNTVQLYKKAKSIYKAIQMAELLRIRNPKNEDNLMELANLLRFINNPSRAIKMLDELLQINPEHKDAMELKKTLEQTQPLAQSHKK